MFVPPVNFALVVGNVYRSGHPTDLNYGFLESLNLKTIVYIGDGCPESIAEDYQKWIAGQGIEYIHLHSRSVKEPFVGTDKATVTRALKIIIDSKNHPILVHSNKGKHRVGVVMAVLRKCLLQWYLTPIYEEYVRFAKGKTGSDLEFIEQYELENEDIEIGECPKWLLHCQTYAGMADNAISIEESTPNATTNTATTPNASTATAATNAATNATTPNTATATATATTNTNTTAATPNTSTANPTATATTNSANN